MIVRPSTRKHEIGDSDIVLAASSPLVSGPLDDEMPQRQLRIGFDTHARILEIVVPVWDDGTEEVTHAMKVSPEVLAPAQLTPPKVEMAHRRRLPPGRTPRSQSVRLHGLICPNADVNPTRDGQGSHSQ